MSTLIDRLSKLTPEQRLLLERRLKDKQGSGEPDAGELPWLEGETLAARLSWWREHLAGLPRRRLAAPGRRRAEAGRGREPFALPAGTTAELRRLAEAQGFDLSTLLLAVFGALLGRYTGRERVAVGRAFPSGNVLPVEIDLTGEPSCMDLLGRVADAVARAGVHADIPFRQLARELGPGSPLMPVAFRTRSAGAPALSWGEGPEAPGHELLLDAELGEEVSGEIQFDRAALDGAIAEGLALHLPELLAAVVAAPELPLSSHAIHSGVLKDFTGGTEQTAGMSLPAYPTANRLARWLRRRGVAPEDRIALLLDPSEDLSTALLGVLASGAALVVLDPEESAASLADAVAEVGPRWLLTGERGEAAARGLRVSWLSLAAHREEIAAESGEPLGPVTTADHVAAAVLVLDPPGGRRWALLTHGALAHLFTTLKGLAGAGPASSVTSPLGSAAWLAETLWPLTRGAEAVLPAGRPAARTAPERRIEFSLFYFGSQESGPGGGHDLLFEGARFADRHGFSAVWTPERHFHPFGALFPSASINSSALAMITERVHLRAGSVVLPLHNPIRVAEEWALVDSISRGRVGIAFASGWHANDFVFAPENYGDRREVMFRGIETVRRLWRGEPVTARNGSGQEVPVRIFPKPVQPELPVWITVAATPGTAGRAGEIGANVLTHLLGQGLERVRERIGHYRDARARSGFDPSTGHVTLMLHTFVGSDLGVVRDTVRRPFSEYIRSFTGLLDSLAKSQNLGMGKEAMSEDDIESLLAFAFERYFNDSGLFGTPRSAMEMVRHLQEMGVDEVACLIDFGVEPETALAALSNLDRLRELANRHSAPPPRAAAAAGSPGPVLADCPSPGTAAESAAALRLHGSPESGVWSLRVNPGAAAGDPPVLRPLDGFAAFVLDRRLDLVPVGAEGELCIQGEGLARGYLGRPDVTAARFVPSPFGPAGKRLLRTGQRARYRADGSIEWLGLVTGGRP